MGYLATQLAGKRYLLCSGAWATELARMGHRHERCAEACNAHNPDPVRALSADYAHIPVDLLGTNTFGANRLALDAHGLAPHAASINYAGARIARDAQRGAGAVCGLIGPVAANLPQWNDAILVDAYKQQAKALHMGGAQVLWLETMLSVDEAVLAIRAIRETTPCEIICTFSAVKGKLGYATRCGAFVHTALGKVATAGPDALGFNCGNGPEEAIPLFEACRESNVENMIWAFKPNAGLPDLEGNYPHTPETFATQMRHALDKGFQIIGGCCGAGPDYIAALRARHPV